MNTLIVNPNNRILSPYSAIEPPLWAGLVASDLRNKGESIKILDAEALNWDLFQTLDFIRLYNPERIIIVVMGNNPAVSSTPKMAITKKLVEGLRSYKVSVTGLHPSALLKETENELGVEVLKGKIFDGTPDMPFDLLPMGLYRAHNWHCLDGSLRQPYAVVYTSLGCPFSCSFCPIHALYGSYKVWYRDIDAVINEIDLLVSSYGVRNVKFWDELFTLDKERVYDICDRLKGYDLNIWAYARVDTINSYMLKTMKSAGINWLGFGFESGNDTILSTIDKKAKRVLAFAAVEMCHETGINVNGAFMFGLPGDTWETMRETIAFAKSLNLEWANFYAFSPEPGSKLDGGKMDWKRYDQYSPETSMVRSFRDSAFNEFFTDKNYLRNIQSKFGQQGVKQIWDMMEYGKPVTVNNV